MPVDLQRFPPGDGLWLEWKNYRALLLVGLNFDRMDHLMMDHRWLLRVALLSDFAQ